VDSGIRLNKTDNTKSSCKTQGRNKLAQGHTASEWDTTAKIWYKPLRAHHKGSRSKVGSQKKMCDEC
jgi:hypothetical protein